jgi:hypothetical protein
MATASDPVQIIRSMFSINAQNIIEVLLAGISPYAEKR